MPERILEDDRKNAADDLNAPTEKINNQLHSLIFHNTLHSVLEQA